MQNFIMGRRHVLNFGNRAAGCGFLRRFQRHFGGNRGTSRSRCWSPSWGAYSVDWPCVTTRHPWMCCSPLIIFAIRVNVFIRKSRGRINIWIPPQMEAVFSAELIQHNIEVALLTAALGVTFGIGTTLLLFENGVLLGAVAVHYTQQGFGLFVTAWLLPHGAFEIPSILIAGQAGYYLARLLLRRRDDRDMRRSMTEWLLLVAGLAMMLTWAGLVEAFFSQHHAPALPYQFKVAVGSAELVLLVIYLSVTGRRVTPAETLAGTPLEAL